MSQSKRRKAEAAVVDAATRLVHYWHVAGGGGSLTWPENQPLRIAVNDLNALNLELPARARSGARHPLTSEQAQAWMEGARAKSAAARIVRYLYNRPTNGATVDELIQVLNMPHQTCSPRVTELRNEGWVEDRDRVRDTKAGQAAIVWFLTPRARSLFSPSHAGEQQPR